MTESVVKDTPGNGARDRWIALAIFVLCALIYWRSPVVQISDSHYSMLLSENLLEHGSFALDRHFVPPLDPAKNPAYDELSELPRLIERTEGHLYYLNPPGTSLLSIPWVGITKLFGISPSVNDGGYNQAGEVLIQRLLATLLCAGLSAWAFFLARGFVPLPSSLLLTTGFAFGSQIWSSASRGLWPHDWSLVLFAAAISLLLKAEQGRPLRAALLATVLSWAFFVRPPNSLAILAVSVYVLLRHRHSFVRFAGVGAIWLSIFLGWSRLLYGHWLPLYMRNQAGHNMHFGANWWRGMAGMMFSPSRGLMVFVPATLLVFVLALRYRKQLQCRALLITGIAAMVLAWVTFAGYVEWWGGHCYGPRYWTDSLPWLYLLAVCAFSACRAAHGGRVPRFTALAGIALLAVGIFMNGVGAFSGNAARWNGSPEDINLSPARLWDFHHPQFLAPWFSTMPVPGGAARADSALISAKPFSAAPLAADGTALTRLDVNQVSANPYLSGFWPDPDEQTRWSIATRASVSLDLTTPLATRLRITTGCFIVPGRVERQRVRVRINDASVGEVELTNPGIAAYELPVVAGAWRGHNVITFELPDAKSPRDAGLGADDRIMAIALRSVSVLPAN